MRTMHTAPSFSISPLLCGGSGHRADHHSTRAKRRANGKPGFSFAEVMFAVVILGIGFILVAAIFPVAIQQTQSTSEESSASIMAREAANAIKALPVTVANPLYNSSYVYNASTPQPTTDYKAVATELLLPPTVKPYVMGNVAITNTTTVLGYTLTAQSAPPPAVVAPFVGARWDQLRCSIIPPSDPRYSYVPFYRRDSGSQSAQLIVVSVANRQRTTYDYADDAQPAQSQVYYGSGGLSISTTPAAFPAGPVAANTMTVIAPDTVNILNNAIEAQEGWYLTTPPPGTSYVPPLPLAFNRSYRLGRPLSGVDYAGGVYEMEPGDNMLLTSGSNGNPWGSSGTWSTTTSMWINGGIRDAALTGQLANLYPYATLQPVVAYATLSSSPAYPTGIIQLFLGCGKNKPTDNLPAPNAATGAFVIIADDYPFDPSFPAYTSASPSSANYYLPPNFTLTSASSPGTLAGNYKVGALNGRIFRLGQPILNDPNNPNNGLVGTYQLDPAYPMRPADLNGPNYSPDIIPNPDFVNYGPAITMAAGYSITNPGNLRAKVFIVGMGVENLGRVTGGAALGNVKYSNTSQGIGAFSTYMPVQ